MRFLRLVPSLVTVIVLGAAAPSANATGALDPSWSGDGILTWDSTSLTDPDEVTALLPSAGDATFVLSSTTSPSHPRGAAITRLTASGALDASWGGDGTVRLPADGSFLPAAILQRPSGGGVFVVGSRTDPSHPWAATVFALNADGTLDTGWAAGGSAVWSDPSFGPYVVMDAVLVAGDIVVVGWTNDGPSGPSGPSGGSSSDRDIAILSGEVDGSLTGSAVRLDPSGLGHDDIVTDIAATASGALLITGLSNSPSGEHAWVARLQTGFALDPTFGQNGVASLQMDSPASVAPALDGGAVVIGRTWHDLAPTSADVERYSAAGEPMAAFGTGGVARPAVPGSADIGGAVVIPRPDGSYFVAGTARPAVDPADPDDTWWGVIGTTGVESASVPVRRVDLSGAGNSDGVSVGARSSSATVLLGGWNGATPSIGIDSLAARVVDSPPPAVVPVNSVAPTISGSPVVGTTLSCSAGTWSGSPSTFAWSWTVGGQVVSSQSTLLVQAWYGLDVRCVVTASNAAGSASATSAGVTVPAPTATTPTNFAAPSVRRVAGAPGQPYVGALAVCNPGFWTNASSFTYEWTLNNVPFSTSSSVLVRSTWVGKYLRCRVSAHNGSQQVTATSADAAVAGFNRIVGTARADTRSGTTGNDELLLRSGADTARGAAGDDRLLGELGDDRLLGDGGRDVLLGGADDDELRGGAGNDRLVGGVGRDEVYGNAGNDVIDVRDRSTIVDVAACGLGRDTVLANRRDRVVGCEVVRRVP